MNINRAVLCLDCGEVFSFSNQCPTCSSTAFFPLAKWLGEVEKFKQCVEENLRMTDVLNWYEDCAKEIKRAKWFGREK